MNEKQTIVVVSGERYWQDFLPDFRVRYCQLQNSQWLIENDKLLVFDAQGQTKVDSVLWRVGAIRPHHLHRAVLEMIRLSGIPCVNNAQSLLRGFDRISMMNEMIKIGIPQIKSIIATGVNALEEVQPQLPCIVKIGNYHAGYGKMKVDTLTQLMDVKDMYFASDDYMLIEPYIDYERDIRCLVIGENMWAMERRGRTWKSNTQTVDYKLIPVPQKIVDYSLMAQRHLDVDILGLDFLETKEGELLLLEANDIPGISGFPESAKKLLAGCIENKIIG